MKFEINMKKLKEGINKVLIKGKWNAGDKSSNSSLPKVIVISVTENEISLINGDESTYILYRVGNQIDIDAGDIVIEETGRCTVDADILCKYLTGNSTVRCVVVDDKLILNHNVKVSIPLMERHPLNDVLLKRTEYATQFPLNCTPKALEVSDKLSLPLICKTTGDEFNYAIKHCELVGNSIYKLEWDGSIGVLTVSSELDNESSEVMIETIDNNLGGIHEGYCTKEATVEFSVPVHKLVNGASNLYIAFGDDLPVVIYDRRLRLIRAPRVV